MNSSMIRYLLGSVLKIEGALLFLPCLVSLCYQEKVGFFLCISGGFLPLAWFCYDVKKAGGYGFLFERRLCDDGAQLDFHEFFRCASILVIRRDTIFDGRFI